VVVRHAVSISLICPFFPPRALAIFQRSLAVIKRQMYLSSCLFYFCFLFFLAVVRRISTDRHVYFIFFAVFLFPRVLAMFSMVSAVVGHEMYLDTIEFDDTITTTAILNPLSQVCSTKWVTHFVVQYLYLWNFRTFFAPSYTRQSLEFKAY